MIFQSTPSARRATEPEKVWEGKPNISIHALREEGDKNRSRKANGRTLFQSTPSARRATLWQLLPLHGYGEFQSTPSARRATALVKAHLPHLNISIHALREEGDP